MTPIRPVQWWYPALNQPRYVEYRIRILPAPNSTKCSTELNMHSLIMSNNTVVYEPCVGATLPCALCKAINDLKITSNINFTGMSYMTARVNAVANIMIIDDPVNANNNRQVKLWTYPRDMITHALCNGGFCDQDHNECDLDITALELVYSIWGNSLELYNYARSRFHVTWGHDPRLDPAIMNQRWDLSNLSQYWVSSPQRIAAMITMLNLTHS